MAFRLGLSNTGKNPRRYERQNSKQCHWRTHEHSSIMSTTRFDKSVSQCGSAASMDKLRRLPLRSTLLSGLIFPLFLVGCAAGPMANRAVAQDQPSVLQVRPLADKRAQLMFEIMIAELAGRRGYMDVATEGYLRASKKSDDARIAERATKLAVWGQRWDLAQDAANRWIDLEPDATEARELLAQVLMRGDQPEGAALDQFAELVESAEDRGVVLNDIFVLLSRENDRPAALATLKGLQSRFPDEAEAHMGVARFMLQQNDRSAAMTAVEQALEVDPEHGPALLTRAQLLSDSGKPAEGLGDIKKALDKDPDNLNLRLGYARLLADVGQYTEANEELEYLFENASDNSDVLLSIGLLALDSKRTDAAQRYLEALLDTGDHRDQAHYYLARIDDQKQSFEAAIKHYESVGEGDLYLSSQLRSAELYAASGQLDIGIERVRSLSNLLPDPSMQPMLITTESRMLQEAGKNEAAVDVLTAGLEKYPRSGELLYARALASDRTGDTATLLSDLEKLIVAEPENANALNALGYFLADENQRLDEAEGYLEKAMLLKPDDPAIMDSLGWLRFRQGDSEAAKRLLERAYELFPDAEIAAHLGEVLWVSGDKTAARSVWEKALVDEPEHAKLVNTMERLTE